MINTFIIEGELVGIHNDSIDILTDNKIKINVLAFPTMIEIINESETIAPIVGINGRFILDKDNNIKMLCEKFTFLCRDRNLEKQKLKDYER